MIKVLEETQKQSDVIRSVFPHIKEILEQNVVFFEKRESLHQRTDFMQTYKIENNHITKVKINSKYDENP